MTLDLDDLRYVVLSPRARLSPASAETRARLFGLWREVWTDEFRKLGRARELGADEFRKHDLSCGVLYRGAPVAVHLHSFYDLRSPLGRESRFAREYLDAGAIRYCLHRGLCTVMSFEALAVAPAFRRSECGVAVAELSARLGMNVFASTHADAVVACTRNTRKINLLGPALGCERVRENVLVNGEPSDLFVGTDRASLRSAAPVMRQAVERLWRARLDVRDTAREAFEPQVLRAAG